MARQLIKELESKGDAAAIASWLGANGFTGVPYDDTMCPIANYLKSKLPNKEIQVTDTVLITNGETEEFDLPENCHDFIDRFDRGEFSELAEGEDEEDEDYDEDEDDFEEDEDLDDDEDEDEE